MRSEIKPRHRADLSPRAAIPVVERFSAPVCASERRRLDDLARKMLRNDPSLARTDPFGERVSAGIQDGPAFLLGDQREIALYDSLEEQMLEHRIALLADASEIVVV